MLSPHLSKLNQHRIILASASPRRQELLSKQLGVKYEVHKKCIGHAYIKANAYTGPISKKLAKKKVLVSSFEELLPKEQYRGPEGAARYAVDTAKGKVLDVCRTLTTANSLPRPVLVIGADTVVEHDGAILEKPDDAKMAYDMLRRLSGGLHHVHTGVVLATWDSNNGTEQHQAPLLHTFSSTTSVVFDELNDAVLHAYIESGEPFGKAGSYGIQGMAGSFVKSIDGCFFNVVGFPVHKFASELMQLIEAGKLRL